MKKYFIAFIIYFYFCPCANSEPDAAYLSEKFNSYIEVGLSTDSFGLGAEVGFLYFVTDYVALKGGFFLLGGSDLDDVYGGVSAGVRLQFKNTFSPIFGAGIQAGYSEETDPVFDDKDIDNLLFSFYPEVGFQLKFTNNFLLSFTARNNYVFTTEEESIDPFWRFHFAIHLLNSFIFF